MAAKREAGSKAAKASETSKPAKKTGMVTTFNEKRGVGYIECDDVEDLLVVHQEDIDLPGYATLETGQFVEFEVAEDDDANSEGRARNVKPTTLA